MFPNTPRKNIIQWLSVYYVFTLKTLLHKSTEAGNTDVACLRLYCLVPLRGCGFVGYFRSFLPLTMLMPFCTFCMRWPLRL